MNQLTKFLVDGILNEDEKQVVALFGGGFKPPTKGHLDVIVNGIRQNPEISRVKIIVGGGIRNGFTQDQSAKIWEIYRGANLIPIEVDIVKANPFKYYKDYLTENPNDKVFVFIGSRPENDGDQFDVKERSEYVKKYSDNVIPVEVATSGGVSGTEARDLYKNNIKSFRNMFPDNLSDDEYEQILTILGDKNDTPKEKPNKPKTLSPLNENATYSSKIDYKQQIKDLTKHMLDKDMNIQPLPKVIFKHGDQENASQFLGKTAYYSPDTQEIILYTEGRHPKDIVRSFAHEMIHHIQNLEGRLEGITTTNTQEDDHLNDIEREAYTKGNMTFRNWTDSKDGEEVTSLNEIGDASSKIFSYKKTKYGLDAKSFKEITDEDDRVDDIETENVYEFETDLGTKYVVSFEIEHDPDSKELDVGIDFTTLTKRGNIDTNMKSTNKGEQYAVMSTISDIMVNWINEWDKHFYISQVWIEPKVDADEDVEMSVFSQRGRLYKIYLDKQLPRLNKSYKVEQKPNAFKIVPTFKNLKETKKKKPYKHKHGFNDKLGKDPFGLNQFAREIAENDEPFTVYCDMDGVLCDFDLQFKELTNGISPKEYKAEHGVNGFWEIITKQGEKFWSEMPWTPEGKELWSYIKKYNPILLSAPSNDSSSRLGKRQWVDKNLPGVTLKLASKANKPDYATNDKDVLIDDWYGTIVDWKNKGSIGIWYNSYSSAIRQLQKSGL